MQSSGAADCKDSNPICFLLVAIFTKLKSLLHYVSLSVLLLILKSSYELIFLMFACFRFPFLVNEGSFVTEVFPVY